MTVNDYPAHISEIMLQLESLSGWIWLGGHLLHGWAITTIHIAGIAAFSSFR